MSVHIVMTHMYICEKKAIPLNRAGMSDSQKGSAESSPT